MRRGGKKGIKVEKAKSPNPTLVIDALIGDEEQNIKQKETKRKKQGAGPQPPSHP